MNHLCYNRAMSRRRREGALDDLVRAALRVFARDGFRRAQVSDVAREMGVALGTVYRYVESKEALFAVVVDRMFFASGEEPRLPVATPDPDIVLARVRSRLVDITSLPALAAATCRSSPGDVRDEAAMVLAELWEMTAVTRLAADMVERSARDWPELAELFYGEIRRRVIQRIAEYLDVRIQQGECRARASTAVAARAVLESVTWWARHRYRDAELARLTDADARRTVLPMLIDALVGWPDG